MIKLKSAKRAMRVMLLEAMADPAVGLLMLRLMLSVIFFAHGAQKMLGWFGGMGPVASAAFYLESWGIGWFWFMVSSLTELAAGVAVALGFATRVFALGLAINMLVEILVAHLPNGLLGTGGYGSPAAHYTPRPLPTATRRAH